VGAGKSEYGGGVRWFLSFRRLGAIPIKINPQPHSSSRILACGFLVLVLTS
jgi:hypothetical protein